MDLELLDQTLAGLREPRFRAPQVWEWLAKGASSFGQMTNLPLELRGALERELPISTLALAHEARARDGTVKALFHTADGRPLEAVMMRYRLRPNAGPGVGPGAGSSTANAPSRHSICISSQSGCPLTCTFCATGTMRFGRNLSVSEILDQVLHFVRYERERERPVPITNCVFMGMGEPMLNLDGVLGACERLPDIGISHRRIAISTVGWIPGIERLAESELPVRLALSLHAAEESLRSELMPVNERYPLVDVLEACRSFYERKRRRIFVEYVMLAGINDRYEQALALTRVLDPRIFKVNLIPYNPTSTPAGYRGSGRESIAAFRDVLQAKGLPATVRLTRGRDIEAACGQLAVRA